MIPDVIVLSSANTFGFDSGDPNVDEFGDYDDPGVGGEFAHTQLTQSGKTYMAIKKSDGDWVPDNKKRITTLS